MKDVLKAALKKVKPAKAEEKKLLSLANAVMKRIKIVKAKPVLGGSAAKGTWLCGDHDIDVYVKFDALKYGTEDISAILYGELKKNFSKVDILHGSRDYFQVKQKGYTVEVVPIIGIDDPNIALNITDISPLHVEWVRKHKEKADEIRLVKAFCKAGKVYGAESYIKGFSGYVLEILTAHYMSFFGFIQNVAKWDPDGKVVVDTEHHFKGKDIMKELNVAKIYSPLIVIDPVQAERNAAAGVGNEKYRQLVMLARSFLAKPSLNYFIKTNVALPQLKKKAGKNILLIIDAEALKGKKDVVGAKLLKCFEHIRKHLDLNEFYLIESGWEWNNKALLWFIIKREKLLPTRKHYGPPYKNKKAVDSFRKVWEGNGIEIEDGRLYVIVKRKYMGPERLVRDLLKSEYVKQRVKRISLRRLKR